MNLGTLFERFDLLADTPGSPAKLREMILGLAVMGRLVPRDADDTPASSLLLKAREQREELQGRRQVRTREAIPLQEEEHPFELPSGWQWARLSDVGHEIGQKVPKRRFTYVDVGSIDPWPGCISDRVEVLAPSQAPSRARKLVARGSVIYSMVRPYLLNVAVVDRDFECEPIVSTAFGILHPFEGMSSRYLFHWLRSKHFTAYVQEAMKGMAYPAISDEKFYSGPIAVPPLAEQRRIVARVDELMALCDQLEKQYAERESRRMALAKASLLQFAVAPTPSSLDVLFHQSYHIDPSGIKRSLLSLAVRGRLVPQSPSDASIEDLLARVSDERRKRGRDPNTSFRVMEDRDTLGYSIPASWRWQVLGDLLVSGPTNGLSPKAVDHETRVRSLTLSATTSGAFKGEHSKFIDMDLPSDSDLWLRDGDILVQRGNTIEYVGIAAVYRGEPLKYIYPDLMMRLRVSSAVDVGFIHLAMSEQAARDFLRARASGTSGSMPKINQTTLKALPLPIPPLGEQRRIVAKVNELMTLVDELESQLEAADNTGSALLDAVVAELTSRN